MKTARPIFLNKACATAILCGFPLFSASSLAAVGAETVGWKIPLESINGNDLRSPGVVRLEAPPEKSPLFGEKDELWDVSKAPTFFDHAAESIFDLDPTISISQMTHPPMEWAVWNASTQRLVTKCDWRGIWQLYELLGIESQPRQHRYQLALYDSQDGRSMPPQGAKPLISLSSLSRSGMKSLVEGESGKIQIEGELIAADHHPWIDTSLSWSVELPGRAGIRSSAAFTARSGKSMVIAGDVRKEEGWVAVFSATTELVDGTPYEEIAWLVENGKAQRLGADRRTTQRTRVGNKWLISTWVSPANIIDFLNPSHSFGAEADPFAEAPPAIRKPDSFLSLTVPKELLEWCTKEAWDMSVSLKNSGITFAEDDVAGYDPKRQEIFFYSASVNELDKIEQLFEMSCIREPATISLTLDASHPSHLVSRSGNLASLEIISGDAMVKSVRFEPTITDNGYLIDHSVYFQSTTSRESHKLETRVAAKSGVPVVIHQPPGDGKPWVLTSEIHRGHE